jgi:hypothetical protein
MTVLTLWLNYANNGLVLCKQSQLCHGGGETYTASYMLVLDQKASSRQFQLQYAAYWGYNQCRGWLINSYSEQIRFLEPETSITRVVSRRTLKMVFHIPPSTQKQIILSHHLNCIRDVVDHNYAHDLKQTALYFRKQIPLFYLSFEWDMIACFYVWHSLYAFN